MDEKTLEEKVTLGDLYERYELEGISTQLNDGKIIGFTVEACGTTQEKQEKSA